MLVVFDVNAEELDGPSIVGLGGVDGGRGLAILLGIRGIGKSLCAI